MGHSDVAEYLAGRKKEAAGPISSYILELWLNHWRRKGPAATGASSGDWGGGSASFHAASLQTPRLETLLPLLALFKPIQIPSMSPF